KVRSPQTTQFHRKPIAIAFGQLEAAWEKSWVATQLKLTVPWYLPPDSPRTTGDCLTQQKWATASQSRL
ncbi:hypothetical protein, partial [uncultured Meiothermus sp.]|uniref:hypothetical protein n=1 Tax=uncultured Meiothermus sp. TaxID=157471 RepID=UPI002628B863